jgi:hypothetical protein
LATKEDIALLKEDTLKDRILASINKAEIIKWMFIFGWGRLLLLLVLSFYFSKNKIQAIY